MAVNQGWLSQNALNDESYLNAVQLQLRDLQEGDSDGINS
jgi:hypothetical protein